MSKSSMIIANERKFYTPTKKSGAKTSLSNFIKADLKHIT